MRTLIAVMALLLLSSKCFGADDEKTAKMNNHPQELTSSWVTVNDFRGIVWGTPLDKLKTEKKMVLSASPEKAGRSFYIIKNDQLSIGAANLDFLFYLFFENKFAGVAIGTKGRENYTNLVRAASEKYKVCHQENRYLNNYKCFVKSASISLTYNQFNEDGSLVILSNEIQQEKDAKLSESAKIGAKNDF